jgi:hypothetical protein
MKPNTFFFISFIIMIFVAIIAVFFLNRFLFFIYGYNIDPTKGATVEAFQAYKAIYKTKVFLVVSGLVLSIILVFFARKLTLQSPHLIYNVVYATCWLSTSIFTIICIFFIILPTGPFF